MKCYNCGKEIDDDSSFCGFCGTKIVRPRPNTFSRNKKILVGIGLLVGIPIIIILLYFFYIDNPNIRNSKPSVKYVGIVAPGIHRFIVEWDRYKTEYGYGPSTLTITPKVNNSLVIPEVSDDTFHDEKIEAEIPIFAVIYSRGYKSRDYKRIESFDIDESKIKHYAVKDLNGDTLEILPEFGMFTSSIDYNGTISGTWRGIIFSRRVKDVHFTFSYPFHDDHCFTDLGLSVKWATCNVGANKTEDFGDYYAWGETESKNDYSWSTRTTFDFVDDVAHVKWGGSWRMPTKAEYEELVANCTWEWTTHKGVKGYKVTSKKDGYYGCSIFLPATGVRFGTDLAGEGHCGQYGSSSPYESSQTQAWFLQFDSQEVGIKDCGIFEGLSVRPVCP